ncbi:MAG: hypothetical protein OEM97_01670 [Acidimicrobiia bacterium]|nr:hypothetical protein [Acidimicrobiia bacterium]
MPEELTAVVGLWSLFVVGRNEFGVFLVEAGLAGGRDHGSACL